MYITQYYSNKGIHGSKPYLMIHQGELLYHFKHDSL